MYQVRRITCPLCEHRFTEFLSEGTETVTGHDGYWEKLKCPMCGTEILVNEEKDYALLADDVESKTTRLVLM